MLMFDRYYCIKKKTFCSKTLKKLLQKVLFSYTFNGAEKHVTSERFENAASNLLYSIIIISYQLQKDFRHPPSQARKRAAGVK